MIEAGRVQGVAIASCSDESENKFGASSLASTSVVNLRDDLIGKVQATSEDSSLLFVMNSCSLPA
jgi:hypothetical protein